MTSRDGHHPENNPRAVAVASCDPTDWTLLRSRYFRRGAALVLLLAAACLLLQVLEGSPPPSAARSQAFPAPEAGARCV